MDDWWGEVASPGEPRQPTQERNGQLKLLKGLRPTSGTRAEVCSQGPALLSRCAALLHTNVWLHFFFKYVTAGSIKTVPTSLILA